MELGGQIAWVEPELMERVVGGEQTGGVSNKDKGVWGKLNENKGGEEWLA